MMGGGMMGGMTAALWLWVVFALLVPALLVVASVWLVGTGRGLARSDPDAARCDLALRYVRGEIDGEDYRQRRVDLEASRR
jgi:uncharacterized membrane protein